MTVSRQVYSDRLALLRKQRGLTDVELAALLDVHRSTIYRWERGLNSPTPRQVQRLAKVLQRDVEWFYGMDLRPDDEPADVEAVPFVEPGLSRDPWLSQVPWERVQAMTAGALRSQGKTVGTMSTLTGLTPDRLRNLIKGDLPDVQEVLALRKGLGESFDPTPLLARTLPTPSPVPRRVQELDSLSDSDKLEFLMQKVNRLELELFKLRDQVLFGG